MHIMRIFWFSFCCGFIYLLFLTILLSAILWLQNMSTQCLALEPSHCREIGAQDSPLKKSGAEVKPSAASRWGTRPGCIDKYELNSGKFLDLEDSQHLRDTVRGFWGWIGFWKIFEDSKHENGRMNAGKMAKMTTINGTQPSSGHSSGSIAFRCRFVFVQ